MTMLLMSMSIFVSASQQSYTIELNDGYYTFADEAFNPTPVDKLYYIGFGNTGMLESGRGMEIGVLTYVRDNGKKYILMWHSNPYSSGETATTLPDMKLVSNDNNNLYYWDGSDMIKVNGNGEYWVAAYELGNKYITTSRNCYIAACEAFDYQNNYNLHMGDCFYLQNPESSLWSFASGYSYLSVPKNSNYNYTKYRVHFNGSYDVLINYISTIGQDGYEQSNTLTPIIDDINLGVKILQPLNNFSQSQIDYVVSKFTFKVPCGSTDMQKDIKLNFDGYINGTGEILSREFMVQGGYAYGLYEVGGNVGFGEHKELKITVTDPYGKKWKDTVAVHCYEGFVDENSDGEDDRSYDDFWDENPDNYNNEKPDVNLTDLQSMLTGIRGFFESLWGIVPQPIFIVLIGGIMLLIAVGILRAVLG